ncbi:gephyrin-like molybdotransferase receptor GlpR [Kibdelosporangium persicum]|uniref:Transmembrane protein n=1 Tax=Kibdelosporangium persicum TaxID=2698649 RepID=A0ABX2FH89_9PSEU|nr:gephyrin-like molybdotransferase receptor GlpR [Kibdelosporangium persicum]NRN70750.1 putative transmembrane protein [Kibdelosporangium persicum]
MPSSLIVVALVLAWLVVLVPMIVRKRQEIARTADSALAARVVRKGGAEEADMRDAEIEDSHRAHDVDDDRDDYGDDYADDMDSATEHPKSLDMADEADDRDHVATDSAASRAEPAPPRPYRPGRGGFDPEAAALTARAKYAFRQRVVVAMLLLAVGSAVVAAVMYPQVWWGHGAVDLTLVGYLTYLRRQVRIEEEIRQRRMARIAQARRARPAEQAGYRDEYRDDYRQDHQDEPVERPEPAPVAAPTQPPRITHPNAVVVDVDDEDPAFDELDDLDSFRYRRAVGE